MTMPNENHKFFIITFIISLFGCTNFQPSPPFQPIHIPSPEEKPKQRTLPEKQFKHTENPIKEKKPDFIEYSSYHDLGYKITQLNSFIDFIDNAGKKVKSDKIYLARTDYFPLGEKYTNLAKKDIALETGLIKGLVEHGIEIVEKLDFVHPRDPQELA
jgi:hypothetical protein